MSSPFWQVITAINAGAAEIALIASTANYATAAGAADLATTANAIGAAFIVAISNGGTGTSNIAGALTSFGLRGFNSNYTADNAIFVSSNGYVGIGATIVVGDDCA